MRADRHGALDDTRGLWVFAAVFGTFALIGVAASFLTGQYEVGGWLLAGLVAAALFALWVGRAHRSKARSELRTPGEPEGVEWEES